MAVDNRSSSRSIALGVLPGAPGERIAIGDRRPESDPARSLRKVVAREREAGSSTVILVTGSVRPADLAEAALALAASWVGEESRVAVVDLFWGSGAFLDPLAGQREEGLGDHLLFGSSLGTIERKTRIPGLVLIPAGAGSPETRSALEGERMKDFVAGLRERFDVAFLCGAIPVETDGRHPLVSWVDGWVGVLREGDEPGAALGSSFGTVEVTPTAAAPPDLRIEEPERPIPAPAAPPPARKAPRRMNRSILVAAAILLLGIPGAWVLWNLRSAPPGETSQPARNEEGVFPKPHAPSRGQGEPGETGAPDSRVGDRERGRLPAEDPETVAGTTTGSGRAMDAGESHDVVDARRLRESAGEEQAVRSSGETGPRATGPESRVESGSAFAVHVSSYRSLNRAQTETRGLEAKGYAAEVRTVHLGDKGTWYRVWVGRLPSREEAEALARRLKEEQGFDYTRIVKR